MFLLSDVCGTSTTSDYLHHHQRTYVTRVHPMCVHQGLLKMLGEMRVRYLVLPAMKPVVSMWRRSFGFVPLDVHELAALEDRCACAAPTLRSATPSS